MDKEDSNEKSLTDYGLGDKKDKEEDGKIYVVSVPTGGFKVVEVV